MGDEKVLTCTFSGVDEITGRQVLEGTGSGGWWYWEKLEVRCCRESVYRVVEELAAIHRHSPSFSQFLPPRAWPISRDALITVPKRHESVCMYTLRYPPNCDYVGSAGLARPTSCTLAPFHARSL